MVLPLPFIVQGREAYIRRRRKERHGGRAPPDPAYYLPTIYGIRWALLALLDGDSRMFAPIPSIVSVMVIWERGILPAAYVVNCRAWAVHHVPAWRSSPYFLLMTSGGVVGPRLHPKDVG